MATTLKENKAFPTLGVGQAVGTSLDNTRIRMLWIISAVLSNGQVIVPGYRSRPFNDGTTSPQDIGKPDYWLMECNDDATEYRVNLTYTGDNITQINVYYNDGATSPGMTLIDDGTVTLTYDGDNNVTDITTA